MGNLAKTAQETTIQSVKLAYFDQGYAKKRSAAVAGNEAIELMVMKMLTPRRRSRCCPQAAGGEAKHRVYCEFSAAGPGYERQLHALMGLHLATFLYLIPSNIAGLVSKTS